MEKTSSLGIEDWAGQSDIVQCGSYGRGDARMIAWERDDCTRAIETNGNPIWEGEEGFACTPFISPCPEKFVDERRRGEYKGGVMSEQITITITNGFERGILAYDAANGVDVRRGPATYHDDEVSSVEIPQDGKSVAGRTAYSGEERLFWPVELTTSEQVRNALALCKRHNAVLCPYHGKVSDEARAALHDIGL